MVAFWTLELILGIQICPVPQCALFALGFIGNLEVACFSIDYVETGLGSDRLVTAVELASGGNIGFALSGWLRYTGVMCLDWQDLYTTS